jgi:hypothetical protein
MLCGGICHYIYPIHRNMVYIHCKEQPIDVVYGEKIAVWSQAHPKHTNTLSRQNAAVLGFTLGTKITYLCDLKTEK